MKTQFTKGEWVSRINQLGIDVFERISGFGIVDFGNENTLFECDYPKEEAEANARLISAAPDLFKALLNIENDDNRIPATIWEMRNKALNKALGQDIFITKTEQSIQILSKLTKPIAGYNKKYYICEHLNTKNYERITKQILS